MDITSYEYKRAFDTYMRKGIPIEQSLLDIEAKANENEKPTSHYIWRTRGDQNVRPEHAQNNDKTFAWDSPQDIRAKISSLLVGWRPDVALKFPDGRILLRGDYHKILFWDEDSVGGIYNTGALNFEREPFIYVKEIGYISELRNPKLTSEYFELKVQSGTITRPKAYVTIMAAYLSLEYDTQVDSGNNWHGESGDGIGSTGKYRQGWCSTALI